MSSRPFKNLFFWLSGAGAETLEQCPNWEQRKYVAFGATVLVPTVFALIACAYALSTLTNDWRVIVPVSIAWGFIILTIDRALLATYRAYQGFFRKAAQFSLRMQLATQQLSNTSQLRKTRRDIARVRTVLQEKAAAK